MTASTVTHHVDMICVGFGPAAIALACALEDWREEHDGVPAFQSSLFLERAADTVWQPELLLAGTDINHHPFRDLVTPRNPRSRFSFAMYLKEKGRLYRFGQLGRPASRIEWSDYVGWVAEQLSSYVAYNEAVTDIVPQVDNGELTGLTVITPRTMRTTRRLVLANGSQIRIPAVFQPHLGPRVFHTAEYLTAMRHPELANAKRWLVVGSGQSASEVITDILHRHPDGKIHSVHRSSGFKITQLGQFPNMAFSPERVDYFHDLPGQARQRLLDEVKGTNYSGIDPEESQALFSIVYEDQLVGRERLIVQVFNQVVAIRSNGKDYAVTLRDVFNGEETTVEVDAIIAATGYEQPMIPPQLAAIQPWLVLDDDGGIKIGRNYHIETKSPHVGIFACGLSERSHGISDGQSFSLMAMRADRILQSMQVGDAKPVMAEPALTA